MDQQQYPRTYYRVEIQREKDVDGKERDGCYIDQASDNAPLDEAAGPGHECWHCRDEKQPANKSAQGIVFAIDIPAIEPSRHRKQQRKQKKHEWPLADGVQDEMLQSVHTIHPILFIL